MGWVSVAAAIGVEYVTGIFCSISRVSFVSILDLILSAFPCALLFCLGFYFIFCLMFCVLMIWN